ncbi:hypothetical protein AVEN_262901-1 [Araneus ventricosus]|uniref:Uncharacterized protein n=1 Tax=Araneus ventricosus TaxID=182803 RepID=A0A4Y2DFZ7_ARAVE|nr:hypothetical protein AVEN_262901-1 [Araneus ventricosus]
MPIAFPYTGQIYHMVSPLFKCMKKTWLWTIVYLTQGRNRRMENNKACLHSEWNYYLVWRSMAKSWPLQNPQTTNHSVMEKLDTSLRSINPFAESYLQMQSNPAVNVKMIFMEHPDFDLSGIIHLLKDRGCCNICRR